ncbi:galactosylceramide sulfotransferase-like [Saccoglossus kowalevskii]|uniref:Galactosylceramide sulfotransferase-like n=1 Tax=Saccoglossus kowalevskii TaxID=10224 RepID=A0ABM0GPY8_SACKO|nr:PREDICTED: galactosylceramide sulfotransferase-like [Saccoglossus kowalevskii]
MPRRLKFHSLVPYIAVIVILYMCFLIGIQLGQANSMLWRRSVSQYVSSRDFEDPLCKNGVLGCISNKNTGKKTTITDIVDAVKELVATVEHELCREQFESPTSCEAVKKVVFIKTHKTGSTTAASIIERFGYSHNLSFVVPPDRKYGPHILSSTHHFTRSMLKYSPPPLNGGKYYDMLTNHVRYNRREMNDVIPNATYVTILRHPAKQFESAFAYFLWNREIVKVNGVVDDPIATFMEYPGIYLEKKFFFWWQAHNGQLFDLGLQTEETDDYDTVNRKIETLSAELDVVLIADYFDESLIVLRKKMCWTLHDILYIPNGIRRQKYRREVSDETRAEILEWNRSDVKLYEHFNRTLWKNVAEYGPCFERDLNHFREQRQKVMEECIDPSRVSRKDPRENRYVLKNNASELCVNLWRGDVTFTDIIRKKQIARLVYPQRTDYRSNM